MNVECKTESCYAYLRNKQAHSCIAQGSILSTEIHVSTTSLYSIVDGSNSLFLLLFRALIVYLWQVLPA